MLKPMSIKPLVQKKETRGGGMASRELESSINSAKSSGQPLDANLQQSMGSAIGADFSEVKIHTDSQSDQLNRSLEARAFTTGNHIFFKKGEYNPANQGGQELIAHELTHVVQQNTHSIQTSLIQRDLDTTKIEDIKQKIGLTNISILEVPNSGKKGEDLLSSYRDELKYETQSLEGKTLIEISLNKPLSFLQTNSDWTGHYEYYGQGDAHRFIEGNGGGYYVASSNLAVIGEGQDDIALQHEMGHGEQNERLGATGGAGGTANRIILEFHNVLSNENPARIALAQDDSDLKPRISYTQPKCEVTDKSDGLSASGNKHKKISWENFLIHAKAHEPKNEDMLDEIEDYLGKLDNLKNQYEIFGKWAKAIERNLVGEYKDAYDTKEKETLK
ncbi:MAG: DUF4157 domain-containing protein [Cyanobacteria bacterium SBLK]|nr:DUF4157 domain-containing protein [Cyanobacteria bacterium SBLK]